MSILRRLHKNLLFGAEGAAAPVEIIPYMWYNLILGVVAIASIYIPFADGVIRKDPWNWKYRASESVVKRRREEEKKEH